MSHTLKHKIVSTLTSKDFKFFLKAVDLAINYNLSGVVADKPMKSVLVFTAYVAI